jgi:hypothetical protein
MYPELATGRFAVIADFEDPRQLDLFRVIRGTEKAECLSGGSSRSGERAGPSNCVLQPKGGRSETGRRCLSFTAASMNDAVLIANTPEGKWHLKRDWRAYDLLLLSVESPVNGLTLDMSIASGPPESTVSAQSSLPLTRGWNVLRLDLAEIGELIALDDVQEMRIGVSTANTAVVQGTGAPSIRLDDLLLSGNREDLFGDARDTAGRLYVQRVGRRWNVGAGGRFELTFSNGQITHWYNLVSDPNRLRNLVQGGTLGPIPVALDASGNIVSRSGSVVARQRLVEMSPVRAVVAGEWRFSGQSNAAPADCPFHRWVYTIYPTGQIYVALETNWVKSAGVPPSTGLAMTLSSPDDGDWSVRHGGTLAEGLQVFPPGSFVARSASLDTALLWVLDEPSAETRITQGRDASAKHLSVVIHGEPGGEPARRWSGHLFLTRSAGFSDAEAASRAKAYESPPGLRLELGTPAADPSGVSRTRSWDASEGCLVIQPDQGRVRLTMPTNAGMVFSPVFRITGTAGADCWVYVDHLVLSQLARNTDDEVIFQLPSVAPKGTLIEVLSRRPRSPSP